MKVMIVFPAFFETKEKKTHDTEKMMAKIRKSLAPTDKLHAILLDSWLTETKNSADLMQLFVRFARETAHYDIIHSFSGIPMMMRAVLKPLLVYTPGWIDEWTPLPSDDVAGNARITIKELDGDISGHYKHALLNRKKDDERPWGYWESLYLGEKFKVKHIFAAAGELLSLQRHEHRTEVWTVVEGSGIITLEKELIPVLTGDTLTIEKGAIHRAEGGPDGLHIVEIQFGEYLGEDDIERLEDKYGRTT